MASSSTTGLLVGVTIGALILLAAVLAWAFPFWRNWILGRSAQHAGKKYHIRVISQAENTSTPLISIPGHSRGDVSRATTLSYAHDNHAQSMPLMMQPDITQHGTFMSHAVCHI
jgi:ABC-type multidrug transport system fused ATPase/permease subunit